MKLDRRKFFQVSALSGAALSLDACADAIPHARRRPVPGPEKFVETTCGACSAGCGISARVVGKNVVQIEGVQDHPVNNGGMCPRGIAEIQNLYHPERLGQPLVNNSVSAWKDTIATVGQAVKAAAGNIVIGVGGTATAKAPLIAALADAWKAHVVRVELPSVQYPVDAMTEMLGSSDYRYDLGNSDCVLSLGCDWLQAYPSPIQAQRAFAKIRTGSPIRGYIATASARLSTTAARGDSWIPIRPDQMARFGTAIFRQIESGDGTALASELGISEEHIVDVATELKKRKRPLVVTNRCDLETQKVGMAINQLLGAIDREGGVVPTAKLSGLAATEPAWTTNFPNNKVTKPVIVLIDANPRYLAPSDSGWSEALESASFVASLSSFVDESCARANVILPISTPLETQSLHWGTSFSGLGFASAGPPASPTLHDTRDVNEVLIKLAAATNTPLPWSSAQAYTETLAESLGAQDILSDGGSIDLEEGDSDGEEPGDTDASDKPTIAPIVAAETPPAQDSPPQDSPPQDSPPALPTTTKPAPQPKAEYPLALDLHSNMAFAGGLGAHLPYLHGLTDGADRELWRSIAEIHPSTAKKRGIIGGQWIWIESSLGKLRAVARIREGIRPDTIAMSIGLGRKALGHYAEGHGVNPLEIASIYSTTFVRIWSAS